MGCAPLRNRMHMAPYRPMADGRDQLDRYGMTVKSGMPVYRTLEPVYGGDPSNAPPHGNQPVGAANSRLPEDLTALI